MTDNRRYEGQERRRATITLTPDQLDAIADKAAAKAAEKAVEILQDRAFKVVGKTVLEKLFWLAGFAVIGTYLWLNAKGIVK